LSAAEERAALSAGAAGPAAAEAAAAAVQLSLFGEETESAPRSGGKAGSRAQRGATPQPAAPEVAAAAEVAAAVKAADLFNMTPLAAMHFIHELKQKLQSS
jgi:hypothetical protein